MNDFELTLARLSQVERVQYLEDNAAEVVENHFYMRKLSDAEIANCKDQFADQHKQMEELKAELKAISDGFKQKIKDLQRGAKTNLQLIKSGFEEARGTVYDLHDVDGVTIYTYNEHGQLIGERKMRRGQQLAIFKPEKTGTEE